MSAIPLFNQAIEAQESGQSDQALRFYREALELEPDFQPARHNLAILLLSVAQRTHESLNFDAAVSLYRDVLAVDSQCDTAQYNLATILFNQAADAQASGAYTQAIALYRESHDLHPELKRAELNITLLLRRAIQIDRPRAFEVVQRKSPNVGIYDPNLFRGDAGGVGLVRIEGRFPDFPRFDASLQSCEVVRIGPNGGPVPNVHLSRIHMVGNKFSAEISLPVGGWYVIHARFRMANGIQVTHAFGPVGVGEVYIIAGQSYAAAAHDALMTIDDPDGRIVAYDWRDGYWRIAHDPQPMRPAQEQWGKIAESAVLDGIVAAGGSIWPPAFNLLVSVIDMPIGLVNVAWGGASLSDWGANTPLYDNLLAAAHSLGAFRAILWQQGETETASGAVDRDSYRLAFRNLREAVATDLGWSPDWLVAQSHYHPQDAEATAEASPIELALRAGVAETWIEPHVFPGPDTDLLRGQTHSVNRSKHFSAVGQRAAGALWFHALLTHLQQRGALGGGPKAARQKSQVEPRQFTPPDATA